MTSLRDKAKEVGPHKRKGEPCHMDRLRRAMTAAQWREVVEALDDPLIQSTAIGRVLRDEGYPISDFSIQRHRRGVCQCPR